MYAGLDTTCAVCGGAGPECCSVACTAGRAMRWTRGRGALGAKGHIPHGHGVGHTLPLAGPGGRALPRAGAGHPWRWGVGPTEAPRPGRTVRACGGCGAGGVRASGHTPTAAFCGSGVPPARDGLQKGAWAITGLGRVLTNESWVSGGAPMSAFGGRADEDQRPPELPLLATSGHMVSDPCDARAVTRRNLEVILRIAGEGC